MINESSQHLFVATLMFWVSFSTSAKTARCTGRWWSTEQCWDHWRGWSPYWLKTLEANGETAPTLTQMFLICYAASWSPSSLCLGQAAVAVPSSGHGYSCRGRQRVVQQTGQWCLCCVCRTCALFLFSVSMRQTCHRFSLRGRVFLLRWSKSSATPASWWTWTAIRAPP